MEDLYSKAAMDELISRYPKQFRAIHRSDWPLGWHHLVERATQEIAEHYPTAYWAQVKEKYGCLRMYFEGISECPPAAAAETESAITCMRCGSPEGKLIRGPWLRTLCTTCADYFQKKGPTWPTTPTSR